MARAEVAARLPPEEEGAETETEQDVAGQLLAMEAKLSELCGLIQQRDAEIRAELAMGLEIIPTGLMHQDNASAYLLEEYWARPGSMASAVTK